MAIILLCIIGGYFIMMGLVMFVAGSFYGMPPDSWKAWMSIIIPIISGIAIIACTFIYSSLTLSME